jgi:hypothetical protein
LAESFGSFGDVVELWGRSAVEEQAVLIFVNGTLKKNLTKKKINIVL